MSITLLIIISTVLISIGGFNNRDFRYKAIFYPFQVHGQNEWYRFITSGFLHADWLHLGVNMYVLYMFGESLEDTFTAIFGPFGNLIYLLLYLLAIPLSSITTYFKHRENPNYMSLGASGAVSAVLFSFILIYPGASLYLLFIPIPIPAIVLGVGYLIYSYVMGKQGRDNVNHEAHLYGALFGLVFTLVLEPRLGLLFFEQVKQLL